MISQSNKHPQEFLVECLINKDTNSWNHILLEHLFWKDEVQLIQRIPLGDCRNQDKLIWHFTKNGNLSVGSTYHLIRDQTLNSTNTASGSHASRSLSWKRLWKLKVPRKIKVFQWKVCQNILPTTSKLKTRGINLDEVCSFCSAPEEDLKHLFVTCSMAVQS
ncbi:hypothetical protein ACH5RR_029539 [Cinchona calisaya]|uniref:Reverse transcriptase zinc-binding domain-containing protein n=1 Tax=Cinchona calisaya TaxID=153742 RepID=A0ABD2YX58_9GENT